MPKWVVVTNEGKGTLKEDPAFQKLAHVCAGEALNQNLIWQGTGSAFSIGDLHGLEKAVKRVF